MNFRKKATAAVGIGILQAMIVVPQANADSSAELESICNGTATWQDVEAYDGTLGLKKPFVEKHERIETPLIS